MCHVIGTAICILAVLLTSGCERRVTQRFLIDRGFVQSTNEPEIYTLDRISLREAANRLDFSLKDIAPGTNTDCGFVEVRDYQFAIIPQPGKSGLDNPETICSVLAQLIPQRRLDWPKRHEELVRNHPGAARDECVGNMEAIWAMASLYRWEHGTNAEHVFAASELAEYTLAPLRHCPLGTNDYPPFKYASGPRCPNAPNAHVGAKSPETSGLAP